MSANHFCSGGIQIHLLSWSHVFQHSKSNEPSVCIGHIVPISWILNMGSLRLLLGWIVCIIFFSHLHDYCFSFVCKLWSMFQILILIVNNLYLNSHCICSALEDFVIVLFISVVHNVSYWFFPILTPIL